MTVGRILCWNAQSCARKRAKRGLRGYETPIRASPDPSAQRIPGVSGAVSGAKRRSPEEDVKGPKYPRTTREEARSPHCRGVPVALGSIPNGAPGPWSSSSRQTQLSIPEKRDSHEEGRVEGMLSSSASASAHPRTHARNPVCADASSGGRSAGGRRGRARRHGATIPCLLNVGGGQTSGECCSPLRQTGWGGGTSLAASGTGAGANGWAWP
jgi:hypothetical protein